LADDAGRAIYDPNGVSLDVEAIPPDFKAEEKIVAVASKGQARAVRVTDEVVKRATLSPIGGALDLRAGGLVDDPLRAALITIVASALGL
jgi:hypothetical protein